MSFGQNRIDPSVEITERRAASKSSPMTETRAPLFTPVLIGGCIIIMLGFAVRASFGVFQIPIAAEYGWLRSDFSFAIAIQNLAWGIGQPIFGAIAEKFGDRRAIVTGALFYAAGLVLSSYAVTPGQHQLLEILVGFGIAGTGFGVILAVVGRAGLGVKGGTGRNDQRNPGPCLPRPKLHPDLPWLLFLRLPAWLHHRPFSGLRDGNVRGNRSVRHAGLVRGHHNIRPWCHRNLGDRAGEHRRCNPVRLAGRAGGRLYDTYGSYTMVWWIGVGIGAFSAIIHLPIRENAPSRLVPA